MKKRWFYLGWGSYDAHPDVFRSDAIRIIANKNRLLCAGVCYVTYFRCDWRYLPARHSSR